MAQGPACGNGGRSRGDSDWADPREDMLELVMAEANAAAMARLMLANSKPDSSHPTCSGRMHVLRKSIMESGCNESEGKRRWNQAARREVHSWCLFCMDT